VCAICNPDGLHGLVQNMFPSTVLPAWPKGQDEDAEEGGGRDEWLQQVLM